MMLCAACETCVDSDMYIFFYVMFVVMYIAVKSYRVSGCAAAVPSAATAAGQAREPPAQTRPSPGQQFNIKISDKEATLNDAAFSKRDAAPVRPFRGKAAHANGHVRAQRRPSMLMTRAMHQQYIHWCLTAWIVAVLLTTPSPRTSANTAPSSPSMHARTNTNAGISAAVLL